MAMAEKNVAKEALKKVESRLECGICFEMYTSPRVLPCFHVFCNACLEKAVEKSQDKQNLSCPNCRRGVALPDGGIQGLQSAFHIEHLFDIRDTLVKAGETTKTKCEKCEESIATGYCRDCSHFVCDNCTKIHLLWKKELANHKIVTMAEVGKEATSLLPPKKKSLNCPKHPDEKLKIFCETCQELACLYCVFRDHQNHQHDTVSDVFPKHKAAIEGELEPLKEQRSKLTKAGETFDEREKEITAQRIELQAEINRRIDALCQLLQQRKVHLVSQLNQTAEQKLKRFAAQREELELRSAQLQNCIEYVEGSLRTSSPEEVLALKTSTLEQLHHLATELKEEKMEPQERATLELVMENLEQKCKELGMVMDTILCPEECPVTGDGARFAVVGEKANVIVKLVDKKHIPCIKIPHTAVTAQLVDSTNQSITKCTVTNVQSGTCSIDYVPERRGLHQLHVDIAGKPAKDSPFTVTVMPAVTCFNQPIATLPTSRGPWGLAINSKQQLVVATASQ